MARANETWLQRPETKQRRVARYKGKEKGEVLGQEGGVVQGQRKGKEGAKVRAKERKKWLNCPETNQR